MTAPKKKSTARNREATEQLIVDAFERLLLSHGAQGIGVNALAQEAGVNKTLIYRYFDNLAGVASRYAQHSDFWPGEIELIGGDEEAFAKLSVEERIHEVLCNYVKAIRKRPQTVEVLASQLLSPNEISLALEAALSGPGAGVGQYIRQHETEKELADITNRLVMVVNTLTVYLCIRERNNPNYFGVDLTRKKSWAYIEETISMISRQMLDISN